MSAAASPWGLRRLSLLVGCGGGGVGLRLLLRVASEEPRDDAAGRALHSRLRDRPLDELARAAAALRASRDLLRRAAGDITGDPQPAGWRYRRLFNVCLWQRRHPLFVLAPVLDALGPSTRCDALDAVLEAVTRRLAGDLARIPHRIRADVLMTYAGRPFAEQRRLMEAFRRGAGPDAAGPDAAGPDGNSRDAPPPALFIGEYAATVPLRFGAADLPADTYAALRAAFELDKRAGARRLVNSFAVEE